MLNERLALIVGHTDEIPGASLAPPYNYIQEHEFYTVLAGIMSLSLRRRAIEHAVFFRDGIGIDGAYTQVKLFKAAAAIELHFNSVADQKPKGTLTIYGSIPGSKELAEHVHNEICLVFNRAGLGGDRGLEHRTADARGAASVNNRSGIPSILIEPFFGSNIADAETALEKFPLIGDSIIEGFMKWLAKNPRVVS